MIKIKRLSDKIDYQVSYRVKIDGKIVMELANDEIRDYRLSEGEHTIQIVSDFYVSEEVKFSHYADEYIEFECKPDHRDKTSSRILRKLFLGKLGISLTQKNQFYL